MKLKVILIFAITVLATLSFTLISVHRADTAEKKTAPVSVSTSGNEPAGGFLSEDKF